MRQCIDLFSGGGGCGGEDRCDIEWGCGGSFNVGEKGDEVSEHCAVCVDGDQERVDAVAAPGTNRTVEVKTWRRRLPGTAAGKSCWRC